MDMFWGVLKKGSTVTELFSSFYLFLYNIADLELDKSLIPFYRKCISGNNFR